MILAVTLNTAVDKTYTVENFSVDRVHRPSSSHVVAGGKGINVARVYQELGGEAVITGFLGGRNGEFVREAVRAEGLKSDFVRTAGESRVCVAILDPVQKTETKLNESGPEISTDEVDRLKLKFESLIRGMDFAVLSGSVPPGVPDTILYELIDIARHYNVRCVLDSSGPHLVEGLKAKPFMAKPNSHELSEVVGRQLGTIEEAVDVACDFVRDGIEIMLVTFGRDGAIVATKDGVWRSKPPEIPYVSSVGSGDAFAAAFIHKFAENGSVPDALTLATGAGAANATYFGAGFCGKSDILERAENVEVTSFERESG